MSSPRRGRGRRDNGLDAALWAPLRDVDPRVGEHLLDLLREEGIAAYLEPAADVGEYTRTVHLPSPPSDRLYVDRAQRVLARQLVEDHADDHAPEPAPAPPEVDADAEWARIVAAYELENGRLVVEPEPAEERPAAPHGPRPERAEELRPLEWAAPPEEHYEPPPPPPLGAPAPASLYAVVLVVAGAVLVLAPGLLRVTADVGIVLGVLAIVAGVAVLVSRMREHSAEDGDDGAVV